MWAIPNSMRLQGRSNLHSARWLSGVLLSALLAGCGGGSETTEVIPDPINPIPPSSSSCETSDSGSNSDSCGTVLIGMTDADGDFLQYEVEVVSLSLERANGARVNVLPTSNIVDFAQYVDVTELVTAATVPVGTYVRGEITLDYTEANIYIEKDGEAHLATVVNESGEAVEEVTLALTIDNRNQLVIAPGVPAMLTADFDLAASHTVNLEGDAPVAELYPVLVAEVNADEQKDFRMRGPLIEVDETEGDYRIALRPFQHKQGRLGGIDIVTDSETSWEIDGEAYVGATGLTALAELEAGTATLAMGVFNRSSREFTADSVLVGSSVPGADLDAVSGHVIARDGDRLTVRGANLVRVDGEVQFNQAMEVQLGEMTQVSKPRRQHEMLGLQDISVGQRIRLLGSWDAESEIFDAREGHAHLLLTRLSATASAQTDSTLEAAALSFGGREVAMFDFAGTGVAAEQDADPAAYEVDTAGLGLGSLGMGSPLQLRGYVAPFGSAPADFNALSITDFSDARARLLVGWAHGDEEETEAGEVGEAGVVGEVSAIASLSATGLTLSADSTFGAKHHILRGSHRTDLLELDGLPAIEPADSMFFGRGIYTIAQRGSDAGDLVFFSDFESFASELDSRLMAGAVVKRLHARGHYDDAENRFGAVALSVVLREAVSVE
ncbi:DUF4382 domain-containing protein [Microbulbifer agarilyticus]